MGFTMLLRCFHPPTPHPPYPPSQSPKAQKIGEVLVGRSSPRPLIIIINNQSPLITMNNHQSSIGCAHIGCGLANYLLNWSVKVLFECFDKRSVVFSSPISAFFPRWFFLRGYSILSVSVSPSNHQKSPTSVDDFGVPHLKKTSNNAQKQTEKINCKKW